MTSDYTTMIATLVQVQGAMLAAAATTASRCLGTGLADAEAFGRSASHVLAAPAETRQGAIEDALVVLLRQHRQRLRGLAGAADLAALAFLNALDRQRGPRPVPSQEPRHRA